MTLRLPLLACLAIVLVPAADASAASCRGFTAEAMEVTRIRATGVGCTEARRQARAWVRSDDCNPVQGNPEECTLRRYLCTTGEDVGYTTPVSCRRSGRRVTFRVGPP